MILALASKTNPLYLVGNNNSVSSHVAQCNPRYHDLRYGPIEDNIPLITANSLLGDWAGASFATSGCPGECGETVQNPNNFVVSIMSLKMVNQLIYRHRMHLGISTLFESSKRKALL